MNPLRGVDPRWLLYGAGLVLVGYAGWKLYRAAGSVANVAGSVATAAGQAAGAVNDGIASGVGVVGGVVGLPTPEQTISDPAQVRYIIDRDGWFTASKWATAGALWSAMSVPVGAGVMPPVDSPAAIALGYRFDWEHRPIDFGTGDGW